MQKTLSSQVFPFFESHIDPKEPILLGLSGGADSSCLLHLVLEYKKENPIDLRLVHVDHGWREESQHECEELQRQALSLKLPIYTKRLDPTNYKGNLEAESRRERIDFFTEIATEINAQGILLAHHKIDQQETVLKRILEGSFLVNMAGMKKVSQIGTLTQLRPLLHISKDEILAYLLEHKISFFDDPTNYNTKLLRANMRANIFPFLKESFGKDFQDNILKIAKDCEELASYLQDKIEPYLKNPIHSDFGVMYDLQNKYPTALLELKELFRQIGKVHEVKLNRYTIELAAELFLQNSANKEIETEEKILYIDRRRIFILEKMQNREHFSSVELKVGRIIAQNYVIDVKECEGIEVDVRNNFQAFWNGSSSTVLPVGKYVLEKLNLQKRRILGNTSKSMDKALNEKKVPRFILGFCLSLRGEDGVYEDFLCGYNHYKDLFLKRFLYIQVKRGKNLGLQDFI